MRKLSTSRRVVSIPESHQKLIIGAGKLADVIRPTLGPLARTVMIETFQGSGHIEILDDGGTIARRIFRIPDRDENMGAMLLRNSLWRLCETVGDGTATAAVIFKAIMQASSRLVNAGVNPMDLRRPLEKAAQTACEILHSMTKSLEGQERITQCAQAICHDEEMARLLGEVFYITAGDGYVRAVEWNRRTIEREYFEGCYWTGSWVSPLMINEPARHEANLEDPAVFVTDLNLSEQDEIVPVMEAALAAGRKKLFLVVGGLSGPALTVLLANQKVIPSLAVTSDALYSEAGYLYEDLGYLTGARPLLRATGESLLRFTASDLGYARRAWATNSDFGLVAGAGDPHALRQHTASLRKRLRAETAPAEISLLRKRLGKLLGGVATLHIGGVTETEKKARLEVAKRAITGLQVAMEGGVVPGGGSSLVRVADKLRQTEAPGELAWGTRIMAEALEEPLQAIADNAGYEPTYVVEQVRMAPPGWGFNASRGEIANLEEAGIMDAVAVLDAAVQAAARTAALLLTTDVLVHSKSAEKDSLNKPDRWNKSKKTGRD